MEGTRFRQFESHPSDEQIARFLDPDGWKIRCRVVEDATELSVIERPVSLLFAAVCLSIPVLLVVASFAAGWPPAITSGWGQVAAVVIVVLAVVAAAMMFVFAADLNAEIKEHPPILVLDTKRLTLELPAAGVSLGQRQIVEFVEVFGPCRSSNYYFPRARELSVLVRDDGGAVTQYPVASLFGSRRVRRTLRGFARRFGVPLRTLRLRRQ